MEGRGYMPRFSSLVALITLGLATAVVAPPALAAPGDWDLILVQDKPVIVDQIVVDDVVLVRVFQAVLRNKSGKRVGLLSGQQEDIDVDIDANRKETRLRTLIFRLRGGQIVAQGKVPYPVAGGKFRPGKAFTIAITGGTGKYIGARGEVVSILKTDGTYRQKFRFVD
jgi:hypothetical protein